MRSEKHYPHRGKRKSLIFYFLFSIFIFIGICHWNCQ